MVEEQTHEISLWNPLCHGGRMVIADDLSPIQRQDICNQIDDVETLAAKKIRIVYQPTANLVLTLACDAEIEHII